MKNFAADFKKIYQNERIMLILMIINLLAALTLFIFALVRLNPNSSVVVVSYSDLIGYSNGTWAEMLAFPILGLIFGVFHNLIAVRVYHKRGAGMTKFFLLTTTILIVGAFIVLIRLLEGQ